MTKHNKVETPDGLILNEVQLLLAEKRTLLSTLRTGITVSILPFSVVSFLIATSRYYEVIHVMHLMIPLMGGCILLAALGGYLIVRAIVKIHWVDKTLVELKRKNSLLAEFIK